MKPQLIMLEKPFITRYASTFSVHMSKEAKMRTVKGILDLQSGRYFSADDFLNRPEDEVFVDRRQLEEAVQENRKTLVCAICRQALKIRGDRSGRVSIHFAHLYDSGDCPIKSGKNYSEDEILRMKYNGAKESDLHIELKNGIADTIGRDGRFSDIKVDKTFKSEGLLKEWKKPDVSATFGDSRIVFEIQLSTTFLSVIVQRESFYQRNGTYIMWVFNEFNTDIDVQTFCEKDIIYSNNHNAFVVNAETLELSEQADKFMLYCYFQRPMPSGRLIWDKELISFDDVTFDRETYKVYYFDTTRERERLQAEALQKKVREFEEFWLKRHELSYEERRAGMLEFEGSLNARAIEFRCADDALAKVLDALFSLKHQRIIGYDFKNYVSLANNILEYRKPFGEIFLKALKHYNLARKVLDEDKSGAFMKKVNALKSQKVGQNATYDSLFRVLFPGLLPVPQVAPDEVPTAESVSS